MYDFRQLYKRIAIFSSREEYRGTGKTQDLLLQQTPPKYRKCLS